MSDKKQKMTPEERINRARELFGIAKEIVRLFDVNKVNDQEQYFVQQMVERMNKLGEEDTPF